MRFGLAVSTYPTAFGPILFSGELARRLNTMAEQLQNLLHTRQDLAALEERNRIARELHDSVKQQVFATAMQLGAARALLPDETSPAAQRLASGWNAADGLFGALDARRLPR